MRYRRADVAGGSYFFTLVTENRRPLFEEPAAVALFLGAVEKVRARHPFEVNAYVVLPDHLHAMRTYFLGSNAGHVVRYAKCSVLVVRN